MENPVKIPEISDDLFMPASRIIRPAADAHPDDFFRYEENLIRNAEKWVVHLCEQTATLFDVTDEVDTGKAQEAIADLYGGGYGEAVSEIASNSWLAARHLIEPVGATSRILPSVPPSRFCGASVLVPVRSSAHEAAVAAPEELLYLFLIRHVHEGVLNSDDVVLRDPNGRLSIPRPLRIVFLQHCNVSLIKETLAGFDGGHYRDLEVRVKAESKDALQFARETMYRVLIAGDRYRPPTPSVTHFANPSAERAYAEGHDGPFGETHFRFAGTTYQMPDGKPSQLIAFLWRQEGREASFKELEDAQIWEPERATEAAVKKAISRGNEFFVRPPGARPGVRIPHRLQKVEKSDRVRMIAEDDGYSTGAPKEHATTAAFADVMRTLT